MEPLKEWSKQKQIKSLDEALVYFDLASHFQDFLKSIGEVATCVKSMMEHDSYCKTLNDQMKFIRTKHTLENIKSTESQIIGENMIDSIIASFNIFHTAFIKDINSIFRRRGTESGGKILLKTIRDLCDLFFTISRIKQNIILGSFAFTEQSQLCLSRFLENDSNGFTVALELALFHLGICITEYEKLLRECAAAEDLKLEIFPSAMFLITTLVNDCTRELNVLKNLQKKFSCKQEYEHSLSLEEKEANSLEFFVYYVNIMLLCKNLVIKNTDYENNGFSVIAGKEQNYNDGISYLDLLFNSILNFMETDQSTSATYKTKMEVSADEKCTRKEFCIHLIQLISHLQWKYNCDRSKNINILQPFVRECLRIIDCYSEQEGYHIENVSEDTDVVKSVVGEEHEKARSDDDEEHDSVDTEMVENEVGKEHENAQADDDKKQHDSGSTEMDENVGGEENEKAGSDDDEEHDSRDNEMVENVVGEEHEKARADNEMVENVVGEEHEKARADNEMVENVVGEEHEKARADNDEIEHNFSDIEMVSEAPKCGSSPNDENGNRYAVVKSSNIGISSSSKEFCQRLNSGFSINTLHDALRRFGISQRFKELEESLEGARRNKKSQEEHESLLKDFDKELQNLSRQHHPDRVRNKGGSEVEIEEAQKLQSALNATRTVLSFLNKIFLEDLDIDHKYGFFSDLKIDLLGNEDEVENHVFDILFKISYLSEIKQQRIIAGIRKFLIKSENCLNSFISNKKHEFEQNCFSVINRLEKCIQGYEKLVKEYEEVEKECTLTKAENMLSVLQKLKNECSSQWRSLKKLYEIACLSLKKPLKLFRSSKDLDDYYVLPFVHYVNIILMCHAMRPVSVSCLSKVKNLFWNERHRAHQKGISPDEDPLFTDAFYLASYYIGDSRYQRAAMDVLYRKRHGNGVEDVFRLLVKEITEKLKSQFKIHEYIERSANIHVKNEIKNCMKMVDTFDKKAKELAEEISEFRKETQKMIDEYKIKKEKKDFSSKLSDA